MIKKILLPICFGCMKKFLIKDTADDHHLLSQQNFTFNAPTLLLLDKKNVTK
jgi:hypothetical protein